MAASEDFALEVGVLKAVNMDKLRVGEAVFVGMISISLFICI